MLFTGGLFIGHGMGAVIGENAEIGDGVAIYQEATLEGDGSEKGKRLPATGDNAVVSTGAKTPDSVTVGGDVKIGPTPWCSGTFPATAR